MLSRQALSPHASTMLLEPAESQRSACGVRQVLMCSATFPGVNLLAVDCPPIGPLLSCNRRQGFKEQVIRTRTCEEEEEEVEVISGRKRGGGLW